MATIYLHPSVNSPQAVDKVQSETGCTAIRGDGNFVVLVPPQVVRVIDYIKGNY